jgi:hypothetical protein
MHTHTHTHTQQTVSGPAQKPKAGANCARSYHMKGTVQAGQGRAGQSKTLGGPE